jgi:uncharacterized protein with FMN-binding domain
VEHRVHDVSFVLGKRLQRIIKLIHVVSAAVWLGCLVAIILTLALGSDDATSRSRFGLDLGAHALHDVVLFWAFVVTLATGLVFSTLTSWGMFRHHWITVKWLLALGLFAVTFAVQNPALAVVAGLSDAGLRELDGLNYHAARETALATAIGQLAVVVAVFALSTLKPWGQRKRDVARKPLVIVAGLVLVVVGALGAFNHARLEHIRSLPLDVIPPASRADGTWLGSVDDCGVEYEVSVTIANGRLVDAAAIRTSDNHYGRLGGAVLPRIVEAQSVAIDAITGATTTSRCLARAAGRALRDAPLRSAGPPSITWRR